MPESLSSIGTLLSSPSAKGLMAAAGTAGNLFNGVEGAIDSHRYSSAQSYLNNLIQNPAAYQAAAQKYIQPLNQGLVSQVTNQTNAQLAERGLGGSSAITQATLAQALAPYIQQNQQQGYSALQSSLGMIPGLKPQASGGFGDISKLLTSLQLGKSGGSPATTANNGIAGTDPFGLNMTAPTLMAPGTGMPGTDLSSLSAAMNPYSTGGAVDPSAIPTYLAAPSSTYADSGGW